MVLNDGTVNITFDLFDTVSELILDLWPQMCFCDLRGTLTVDL